MNWIGLALLILVSYGIVYIYYQAIKFGYKMRIEKKLKHKKIKRKSSKSSYNPYAICRSMQKKYNWSEAKYKRCVKKIKDKQWEKELEQENLEYDEEEFSDIDLDNY